LSGFWHGANWTFIVWGAYHAVLFLPLILMGKNRKYTNKIAEGRLLPTLKEVGQMLVTFALAMFGWIIFRSENIGQAWEYVCMIFNKSLFKIPYFVSPTYIFPMPFILFVLVVLEWTGRNKECPITMRYHQRVWRWLVYVLFIVMIFAFGESTESFIYFQF
jgi:D-alanyl-lipoteichoic acid acyltransferase DltB (MBOAT superfamily)